MLPQLKPMLAAPAQPFDSELYSFEVKWDGVRALAAVDEGGIRIWGRDGADYTSRYPELAVLRGWPAGTLVDGELVALRRGRADLKLLLSRHFLTAPWKLAQAQRWCPVHYVVFDLLYHAGRCLMREPLAQRRQRLAELCLQAPLGCVVYSAGVLGTGRIFYKEVLAQGHEGAVAKLLGAPYLPGRRSPAWRKIKPPYRRGARRAAV